MGLVIRTILLGLVVVSALVGVDRSVPGAQAEGPGTWTATLPMPLEFGDHEAVLMRNGQVMVAGGDRAGPPSGFAYKYFPATNSWGVAGSMITPRILTRLAPLRDGRVFMTGGLDGDGPLSSTEFWSPLFNTWTAGPPMSIERVYHTATLLLDGRVLVTGGGHPVEPEAQSATAEIYDPATNSWSPAASMAVARSFHKATLLPDGRVFVVGGAYPSFTPLSSAEIYDPATDAWSPAPPIPGARFYHTATLLPATGTVLVAGGHPAATAQLYDPATNSWTAAGTMVEHRNHHAAALLGNGKVLVVGGDVLNSNDGAEVYDPATNTWAATDSSAVPRVGGTLTVLHDGRVLSAGGADTPSAEVWDPTVWEPASPMTVPRASHSLSLLQDGRVLAAGGRDGGLLGTAEVYDETTDSWSPTGSMVDPREGHATVTLANGRVFAVGGFPQSGDGKTGEIWNPATGVWTATAPMPRLHGYESATLLQTGRVFVFGGDGGDIYDPATNSWSISAAPPDTGLNMHRATLLADGRVMISGGIGGGSGEPWIYDPMTDSWSVIAGLSVGWVSSAVTLLANGNVLIAGGTELLPPPVVAVPHAEAYIINPTAGTWVQVASMPTATGGNATLLYDGDVLLQRNLDAFRYDVASNTWTLAGNLAIPRMEEGPPGLTASSASVRLPSGRVLISGGRDDTLAITAGTETYDLGIHTDTDGDGYHDGMELPMGQHPWSFCATMRADVNMDGNINSGDQLKMSQNYFLKPPQERVDQDGNLKINAGDQLKLALQIAKSVLMCA